MTSSETFPREDRGLVSPHGDRNAWWDGIAPDEDASTTETQLRYLAGHELAYWAGQNYERLGDLHGAADQFRVAAEHGLGDAQQRLANVLARGHTEQPTTSRQQRDTELVQQRAFLSCLASVTMGGTRNPDSTYGTAWLPPSDLYPFAVDAREVTWLEQAARTLRTAPTTAEVGWRQAVVTATNWGEHLLGSDGAEHHGGRLQTAVAHLHQLAGWAASCLGTRESARHHFARAVELANRADQQHLVLTVVARTGLAELYRHQPSEALKSYQLAQIAAQDLDASRELIVLLAHEAWCYLLLGRHDQVVKLQRRMDDELHRLGLTKDELLQQPHLDEPMPRACALGQTPHKTPSPVDTLMVCAA